MENDGGKPEAATAAPPAPAPAPLAVRNSPLHRIRLFLELIRFSHTIFALPFALLAAAMAWSTYYEAQYELFVADMRRFWCGNDIPMLIEMRKNLRKSLQLKFVWDSLGILCCMVFARSAAMAFNRVVDWRFDAQNPRTAKRHIPAGLLNRTTVILFTIVCGAAFIASTLLFLPNRWPLKLSVPVLVFLCGYSLTKRFTSLAHFWLGAALAIAPLAASIAVLGDQAFGDRALGNISAPLLLGGAILLWVAGFDIIYATQDVDVDRKLKLRSVPALFGIPRALRIAALCHLAMLGLLFTLPSVFPQFGLIWYVGAGAVALLLAYEHAIVRPDDLTRVNTAFFNCNAVVSLGLLAVGVIDLLV
jgi:4-hydroxybenzoate polyprenyltransferase